MQGVEKKGRWKAVMKEGGKERVGGADEGRLRGTEGGLEGGMTGAREGRRDGRRIGKRGWETWIFTFELGSFAPLT